MQAPRWFYPLTAALLAAIVALQLARLDTGRYVPGRGDFIIDTRTGRMCSVLSDIADYSYRQSGAGWCSKPFPAPPAGSQ